MPGAPQPPYAQQQYMIMMGPNGQPVHVAIPPGANMGYGGYGGYGYAEQQPSIGVRSETGNLKIGSSSTVI